ncbi:unnamed protein product [Ambrosiozyma monospora]|uniref:Unnamed protein product n=1 Tax=Ambrosiozyma monospora TaxID=43982 RepID=A0ACB5UC11_AMBMO|nr:unnamed protein product [Ambrosiozyma monospora]
MSCILLLSHQPNSINFMHTLDQSTSKNNLKNLEWHLEQVFGLHWGNNLSSCEGGIGKGCVCCIESFLCLFGLVCKSFGPGNSVGGLTGGSVNAVDNIDGGSGSNGGLNGLLLDDVWKRVVWKEFVDGGSGTLNFKWLLSQV